MSYKKTDPQWLVDKMDALRSQLKEYKDKVELLEMDNDICHKCCDEKDKKIAELEREKEQAEYSKKDYLDQQADLKHSSGER